MIEIIGHKWETIAIIIYNTYKKDWISFVTPNNFSQQLAYMKHPKWKIIEPHEHKVVRREIYNTMETLVIKIWKIRVDFFDNNRKYIKSRIIWAWDTIILSWNSHWFSILEDIEMIEIKQWPYAWTDDKNKFQYDLSDLSIKIKEDE